MAWPFRWFTLKSEAGYFWTTDKATDDYGIYVVQVERQAGVRSDMQGQDIPALHGEFIDKPPRERRTPTTVAAPGIGNRCCGRLSAPL